MAKAGTTEAFIASVGEQVRRLRQASGMTMEQLAATSGVSRRMLGQVELGTANPSLVTVSKIAQALGTDFASLAGHTRDEPVLVRVPDQFPDIWSSPAGSHAALVAASTLDQPAALWDWTLQPGDTYQAEADPPGSQELFLVVEGTLVLTLEGSEPQVLGPGAAARIATDREYAYGNESDEPVRFVRVAHVTDPPARP